MLAPNSLTGTLQLETAQDVGTDAQLEVRVTADSGFTTGATTVSLDGAATSGGGIRNATLPDGLQQAAGQNAQHQVRVDFLGTAVPGMVYRVTINGTPFEEVAPGTGASVTDLQFNTMLAALETKIEQGGNYTVTVGTDRTLTITAVAQNLPFTADGEVRDFSYAPVAGGVLNDVTDPVTDAGAALRKTSTIVFDGAIAVDTGKTFVVNVGNQAITVRGGETFDGVTASDWSSLITVLSRKIEAETNNISAAERTVSFAGIGAILPNTDYRLTIGGLSFTYRTAPLPPLDQPQVAGDTPQSMAQGFASAVAKYLVDNQVTSLAVHADGAVLAVTTGANAATAITLVTVANDGGTTPVTGVQLDPNLRQLMLVAETINQDFAVGAFQVRDGITYAQTTPQGTPRAQTTLLTLPGTPANSTAFAFTVAGVDYSVTTDASATQDELRDLMVAAVNQGAGNPTVTAANSGSNVLLTGKANGQTFTVVVPAGITSSVTQTAADGKQVSSLTLSANPLSNAAYTISLGGQSYTVNTDGNATQTELRNLLINEINTRPASTMVAEANGAQVRLVAENNGGSFTGSDGLASFTSASGTTTLLQAPVTGVKQQSRVNFGSPDLHVGDQISLTIDGQVFTVTVPAGGATWADVLAQLDTTIDNGSQLISVLSIDAASRSLVLEAVNPDDDFIVSNVSQSGGAAVHRLVQVNGADARQVSQVAFANVALGVRDEVAVTINGVEYAVRAQAAGDWDAVLTQLATKINAVTDGLKVTASLAGAPAVRTLLLTADALNEGFAVSDAQLRDATEVAAAGPSATELVIARAAPATKQISVLQFSGDPVATARPSRCASVMARRSRSRWARTASMPPGPRCWAASNRWSTTPTRVSPTPRSAAARCGWRQSRPTRRSRWAPIHAPPTPRATSMKRATWW